MLLVNENFRQGIEEKVVVLRSGQSVDMRGRRYTKKIIDEGRKTRVYERPENTKQESNGRKRFQKIVSVI